MDTPFILTDDMLWDLSDGLLIGAEKTRLEAYLAEHPAAQQQFQAILNEKQHLTKLHLEVPRTDFSQQVMAAWVAEQPHLSTQSSSSKGRDWIFWALLLALGLVFSLPFWLVSSVAPGPELYQIPPEYALDFDFSQVNISDWVSIGWVRNMSILLLAYMSLMILDKYLLLRNVRLLG